jgi:hypothetical protein
MQWREYIVTFESVKAGTFTRYIRAVSRRDAEYRVVRKFILPDDSTITKVEPC